MRQVAKFVLEQQGLDVIEAYDGPSALAAAREAGGRISLLLTDINMPGMTGIELAKSVNAEFAQIPVLFISSAHYSEERLGRVVPGSAFLRKPFGAVTLIQAVKDLRALQQ